MILSVATTDAAWAARVRAAAAGLGWAAHVYSSLESLLRARRRTDLALVDWEGLGGAGRAQERLADFRARATGAALVLCGEPRDMGARNMALALAWGAVDFLPKSLSEGVLRPRLRSRARSHAPKAELSAPGGGLKADQAQAKVRLRRGAGWQETERLGPREFGLLWFLLERPGVTHSRTALLEAVWSAKAVKLNPETVDRHVGTLRRKLGAAGKRIRTVHGVGYRLD